MSYWKKFKKKYMGDRAFYRHYLLLAVPMILQNAITNLVSWFTIATPDICSVPSCPTIMFPKS